MIAEKNKVVSLTYVLTLTKDENEIIETTNSTRPLTFLMGFGSLLPKFEGEITGKKIGELFDFILKADDAYGSFSEKAIINVPISAFLVDGIIDNQLLQIGNSVPMQDSEGNRLNGIVVEINDQDVRMDFNHPLAGEDLHFKGEVFDIREATNEELEHGYIHQDHQCGNCDSNSGCSADCCN